MELDEEEAEFVKSLDLLSYKPIIYVANVSEDDAADGSDNQYVKAVREFAATEGAEVVVICAEIEQEISSWMTMRKPCSWKNWASANPVWTN